ncbi:MAG: RusA family crossover junction endodeoxyribonuclease [bacterium]
MEKIKLEVSGRPVPAQRMTQKTKWTDRAQKSLADQDKVAWAWKAIAKGRKLKSDLKLSCEFYFNDKRHGDLSNLVKAVEDGLQYANAFDNDKQIKRYGSTGIFFDDDPRAVIRIEEI